MNPQKLALQEAISQLETAVREWRLGDTADRVRALLAWGDMEKNAANILRWLAQLAAHPENEQYILTLLTGGLSIQDLRDALDNRANSLEKEAWKREYEWFVSTLTEEDKRNPLISFTSPTTGQQVGIYKEGTCWIHIPWGPEMDPENVLNIGSAPGVYMDNPRVIAGDKAIIWIDAEGNEILCNVEYRPWNKHNQTLIGLNPIDNYVTDGDNCVLYVPNHRRSPWEIPQALQWEFISKEMPQQFNIIWKPIPLTIGGVVEWFFFFPGHNEIPRFVCARTGRFFQGSTAIYFADKEKKTVRVGGVTGQTDITAAIEKIAFLHMDKLRWENFGAGGKLVRPEGLLADVKHSLFAKEKNLTLPEFLRELRKGV